MRKATIVILVVSHVAALAIGFAAGIHAPPIRVALPSPDSAAVTQAASTSEFGEMEADFIRLKHTMIQVGEVNTFANFVVPLGDGIDP